MSNMANDNSEEGPKIVWTFPLLSRLQSDKGILNFGSRIKEFSQSSKLKERVKGDDEDDSRSIDDLEEDIEQEKDDSSSIFGDRPTSLDDITGTTEVEVELEGEGVEDRQVDVGPESTLVNWTNTTDSVIRLDIEGSEPVRLDPGESYDEDYGESKSVSYTTMLAQSPTDETSTGGAKSMSAAAEEKESNLDRGF